MALRPENPVVGGTVLRRQAIESPDFVTGVSGWIIRQDGSVEFNNGVFRGTISGGQLFIYNGAPGAGNLVLSNANPGTTTDGFGNQVIPGATATYGPGFANAMIGGAVLYYAGSLSGGWAFTAQILTDVGGDLLMETTGGTVTVSAAGNVSISGNLTVSGTFTASGDTGTPTVNNTSTNGVADGTIHGTSGAQSAGTAHTHGPGSFALGSGQHNHDLQNHAHPL